MPRCADCNKFVSYGEPNVDEVEVELNDETLTMSGSMNLTCEQCGSDIASAEMSAEESVADHFERQPDEAKGETAEYELDGDPDKEATDRSQTEAKSRKTGKVTKIKNPRYAKRYYGVSAECTVKQTIKDKDGKQVGEVEEATITLAAEEQASGFESLS